MVLKENDPCWCGSGKEYKDCHMEFDKILRIKAKHPKAEIPTHDMIKTPEQIEGIRAAGVVNDAVLDAVAEKIHVGMTTEEIDQIVYNKTIELGGIPAPLNFEGFPKSVCTSINDQVCHGIPSEKVILRDGDIVNVDCTTIYKGYYADASRMFMIGNVSPVAKRLVRVTKESMDLCIKNLKPFDQLGDLGAIIVKHCHNNGFSVVREVGGHGVGVGFHEDPYVCHVGRRKEGMVLAPGMVFTIEPMVNSGKRHIYLDEGDGWGIYTADGSLSAQWEYTVVMTDKGLEILSH